VPPLAPPRSTRVLSTDAESAWSPAGYAALADRPAVLGLVVLAWSGAGLAVAATLARRGHEAKPWAALGVLFGPLLLGLAVLDLRRAEDECAPIEVAPGRLLPGELTLVVAVLGEPGLAADAAPIVRWLARELREVIVVSPIQVEAALHERDDEVAAGGRRLSQAALFLPGVEPRLALLPGAGPVVTARYAGEVDAAVLVVLGDEEGRAVRTCLRRLRGRTIVVAPHRHHRGRTS
jgi:hypothetical protein